MSEMGPDLAPPLSPATNVRIININDPNTDAGWGELHTRVNKAWSWGAAGGPASGDTPQASNQIDTDAITAFNGAGALIPPYDPETLNRLFQLSNSLRQCVDAYKTNIEAHGHRFEPNLRLDSDTIDRDLGVAILLERLAEQGDPALPDPKRQVQRPTADEIKAKKAELEEQMLLEEWRLKNFFDFCCAKESFVDLREKTRQDIEVTGNGYWEILRTQTRQVAELRYVPSWTVRLCPLDKKFVTVQEPIKVSPISYTDVPRMRQFRRYVQWVFGSLVYFKEFGDPRTLSADTGNFYESPEEFRKAEPYSRTATEMLHFAVHSPDSAYGVPRWIGNLLAVLGSREAEEVNILYFNNKSIPPLAILVSGGRLTEDAVNRIRDNIRNEIQGKGNFHSIMILDAETAPGASPDSAGKMKIEIVPLTDSQQKDALFQQYDERNMDKVGMAFRLPRLLRGDIRDFNRGTADSAILFTEGQVFNPLRNSFDALINRVLMPALGARFFRFVSQSPVQRDPATMAEIVQKLSAAAAIVPADAREIASEILNRPLAKIDELWTRQPVQLTQTGAGVVEPPPDTPQDPAAPSDAVSPNDSAPEADPTKDTPQDAPTATKQSALQVAKRLLSMRALVAKELGGAWFRDVAASMDDNIEAA